MDYELAKQLKDADFPQHGAGKRIAHPEQIVVRRDDFAYMPTLEELIEACRPHRSFRLFEDGDTWHADCTIPPLIETAIGETPTEAVARLWLALNKPAKD